MRRRNFFKAIFVFLGALFVSKATKVEAEKTSVIRRDTEEKKDGYYTWIGISKECVERARKGSDIDIRCINMTFDSNRKQFFSKFNIPKTTN